MAQQYLFPCSCGRQNPVGVAQAGGSITCDCGAQLTVPTLGALRQLPTKDQPKSASEAVPEWTAFQGALFTGGVLVIILGAIIGGYGYYQASRIDITDHSLKLQEATFAEVEKLSPEGMLDLWKNIRDIDLANTRKASHIQARLEHRQYQSMLVVGSVVSVVGLVGFLGSLLGGKKE